MDQRKHRYTCPHLSSLVELMHLSISGSSDILPFAIRPLLRLLWEHPPCGMFAVGNEQYPIIKIPPLWFLQWRRQTAGSCDFFPRWESITAVTVERVSVCVLINWSHSALTGPGLAQDRFLYSVKLEARFCCSLEDICPSFLWRTFSFTVFFSVSWEVFVILLL